MRHGPRQSRGLGNTSLPASTGRLRNRHSRPPLGVQVPRARARASMQERAYVREQPEETRRKRGGGGACHLPGHVADEAHGQLVQQTETSLFFCTEGIAEVSQLTRSTRDCSGHVRHRGMLATAPIGQSCTPGI